MDEPVGGSVWWESSQPLLRSVTRPSGWLDPCAGLLMLGVGVMHSSQNHRKAGEKAHAILVKTKLFLPS